MKRSGQEQAEHPCAACRGMGRVDEPHHHGGHSFHGGWSEARGYECPYATLVTCPVCLGSGRVSDQVPAVDALADAETLRAFQRDPYPPNLLVRTFAPDAYGSEVGALRCGVDAALWARGHFYETELALVDDAVWSARAAFRAVPGLRSSEPAAPELLDALKEIREACCSGMGSLPPDDIARAEAAIRKAEGRS